MAKRVHYHKWAAIVVLLIVGVLTHLEWFNVLSIVTSGDSFFRFDEEIQEYLTTFHTWLSQTNFGSPNIQIYFFSRAAIWSLLAKVGLSYSLLFSLTHLIPIAILGFISPYLLAKRISLDWKIAFAAACFYGSTTYFLASQSRGHIPIAFVYAITPLLFLTFLKALERNKYRDWSLFSFVSTIAAVYEVRIFYLVSFIMLSYFLTFYSKNIKPYIRTIPVAAITFLTLNAFWIIPSFAGGLYPDIAGFADRGLFGNNLFNLPRAVTIFHWSWTGHKPTEFDVQPIPVYFWITPLLVLALTLSLFSTPKLKRRLRQHKKQITYFGTLLAVGIFLNKQSDWPLPYAYAWLYEHIPTFNLFRTAAKFYVITAFGYTMLLTYLLTATKIPHKSKHDAIRIPYHTLIVLLIVSLSLINLIPLFTGDIETMFVRRSIPRDYLILKHYLNKEQNYYRILWMPTYSRWTPRTVNHPSVSMAEAIQNDWSSYIQASNLNNLKTHEKMTALLSQNYFDYVLDLSAIKYIIVPIRDTANDDDFFKSYGDDRTYFEEALDNASYLKKVDMGTQELAVYENKNYKPHIYSLATVFDIRINNLNRSYDFTTEQLREYFAFVSRPKDAHSTPTTYLEELYADPSGIEINEEAGTVHYSLATDINDANKQYILYSRRSGEELFYTASESEIKILKGLQNNAVLALNNTEISDRSSAKEIYRAQLKGNRTYFLAIDETLIPILRDGKTRTLPALASSLELYSTTSQNYIPNPSFENGPWQERVTDCHNFDNYPVIHMELDTQLASNGSNSLLLSSRHHTACTFSTFSVDTDGVYAMEFDFQSPTRDTAGYFLRIGNKTDGNYKEKLPTRDTSWHSTHRMINAQAGDIKMFIYAYGDNYNQSIVRYDNFSFRKLTTEDRITISRTDNPTYNTTQLPPMDILTAVYRTDSETLKNIIQNPSFEEELWQKRVIDCYNYDNNPLIAMKRSRVASDGQYALQLEATRHNACTSTIVPVAGGGTYLLRFDYQSPTATPARYYAGFNDAQKSFVNQVTEKGTDQWHTFQNIITIPPAATTMELFVYAQKSNGAENNIVRYDNFSLIQLPPLRDKYYVMGTTQEVLKNPKNITFKYIRPTKKIVRVQSATTPFFITMSERYHPRWQLLLRSGIRKIPIDDSLHYQLNGFLNSWYVNTPALCQNRVYCSRNSDGSYDMEFVMTFQPQRWFYLGLIISLLSLMGMLACLLYPFHKQ